MRKLSRIADWQLSKSIQQQRLGPKRMISQPRRPQKNKKHLVQSIGRSLHTPFNGEITLIAGFFCPQKMPSFFSPIRSDKAFFGI
jgi:hypothetical protein